MLGTERGEEKLRVVDFGPAPGATSRTPRTARSWLGGTGDDSNLSSRRNHYCSNRVSTAKYNYFTFLPKFLYIMFSRAA